MGRASAPALDIPENHCAWIRRSTTVPCAGISQTVLPDLDVVDFTDSFGPIPKTGNVAHIGVKTSDPSLCDKAARFASWATPGAISAGQPQAIITRSHSLVGPTPAPRPGGSRLLEPSVRDGGLLCDQCFYGSRSPSFAGNLVPHRAGQQPSSGSGLCVACCAPVQGGDSEFGLDRSDSSGDSSGDEGIFLADAPVSSSVPVESDGLSPNGRKKPGPQDFELLRVVGQGAFGKVFQVRHTDSGNIYAMKVMRKDRILEKNHGDYMKAEQEILTKIVHPFIVQLQFSFQTKGKLYLLLDFINGGHLFFQLYRQGTFSEELARLYTAELVCALTHLHKNGIMHRDLKPENVLLDSEGHVKLTDFGLAKEVKESDHSNSLCGTVEYMAPEIILAKGHGFAADWWSVGVLLFEMLTGQPPFSHNNRQKLQQQILKDKIKYPTYFTNDAHNLLKGLLQKDPSKRLGSGPTGSDDIRNHKWFKAINWRKLEAKELQPKFRPSVNGKFCTANFDEMWTKLPVQDSPASTPTSANHDICFQGYTYEAKGVLASVQSDSEGEIEDDDSDISELGHDDVEELQIDL